MTTDDIPSDGHGDDTAAELERLTVELAHKSAELDQREESLRRMEDDALERDGVLATREAALVAQLVEASAREAAVGEREAVADADFAQQRVALTAELRQQRDAAQQEVNTWQATRHAQVDAELDALFQRRLAEVTAEIDAQRESLRAVIAAERAVWDAELAGEKEKHKLLAQAVEKKDGELSAKEDHLAGRDQELESREGYLQSRLEGLDEEAERRTVDRMRSLEAREQQLQGENARLLGELTAQWALVGAFEDLERQLGGKPAEVVLGDLQAKAEEIARLKQELAKHPAPEVADLVKELRKENANLNGELKKARATNAKDTEKLRSVDDMRRQVAEFEETHKSLIRINERLSGEAAQATSELARLRMPFQAEQDEAERRKDIERPLKSAAMIGKPPAKPDSPVDEVAWLEAIGTRCAEFGLRFPDRILAAFHTALKTAEWSPLTVLSGVSGTGKSELPKLYSHFGGIVFDLVSVQPNWDSQESMLGFFNSIDNKFDAQPLLRFLAQSQQTWTSEYPGLHDAVSLVLLDEMNLAHPELYFAQFLSTLEERRSHRGRSVPNLDVKIGAGLKEYQLPLGRNVLWAGTMNQDETTKSLSDKVVDRSIMIHFPRPTTLERRIKQNTLEDFPGAPLLHRKTWDDWCAREVDFGSEIDPYKAFVEEINSALAVAGRAIGHRVWQSVEFYMANYPAVRAAQRNDDADALRAAMHVAFEDQLVQKIMPKLRGIETRGATKTLCLDRIESLVVVEGVGGQPFNLARDFEFANQLGYGQFIWQSASYLEEDVTEPERAVVADESVSSAD